MLASPETTLTDPYDVLVVDDNVDLLELATRALRRAGILAVGVKDLASLEMVVRSRAVKLILMDVHMPELFGDDVATTLRDARGVTSKIVLYSSLDAAELATRAREAGLDGAISKSDGIPHMVEQVRNLLRQSD